MRESFEFRVQETFARQYLHDDEGKVLGDPEVNRIFGASVRKLVLETADPRCFEVGQIARLLYAQRGEFLYHGWQIHRTYTRKELEAAELLELTPTSMFEPAGETCGTSYDYTNQCPFCGSGRSQISELVLDLRKAPKTRDVAITIGSEWIVSQCLAEMLTDKLVTGVKLGRVRHKARYQDDSFAYSDYPYGRELIRQAKQAGVEADDWSFGVWVNRPEQSALLARFHEERLDISERRSRMPTNLPVWHLLTTSSNPIGITPRTRFGADPFIEDPEEDNRCPLGHVLGLNVLSELYVDRSTWDGSDINVTRQMAGIRRGVLVPRPFVLISQRLYRLLRDNKIRGYKAEVVHII
jgi:hypothetical protein